MADIFCTVYSCRWSELACAARHVNALNGGTHPVGRSKPGADDPNCRVCPDGIARALALGPRKIMEYRKMIADIRGNFRSMLANKRKTKALNFYKEVKHMEENPAIDTTAAPTPEKPCRQCKITKDVETGYYKNPILKDGHESVCKACKANNDRIRRQQRKAEAAKTPGAAREEKPEPKQRRSGKKAAPPIEVQVTPAECSVKSICVPNALGNPIDLSKLSNAVLAPAPALSSQIGGDHYKNFPIQPIEFSTRNNLGFIQGCVVKRICRYNLPGGKGIQDLEKIIHEVRCLIQISGMGKEAAP